MQIYLIENISKEGWVTLTEEDAKHCSVVMRNHVGDIIWGTDGKGTAYRLEISAIQKNRVQAKIQEEIPNLGEPKLPVYMAFALLSNPNRMEVLVEKAVELGVTHLFPFVAKRSEKKHIQTERLNRIAIAAMKQCKRSKVPEIRFFENTTQLIMYSQEIDALKLIGYCEAKNHIKNFQNLMHSKTTFFMVGPEGDFTETEILQAQQADFQQFSLGETRFRAETAAIHILSIHHFCKQ